MSDDIQIERVKSVGGRAFLLRVWRTTREGDVRASVRDVDTEEVRVFVDLQDLASWLARCIG